MRSRMKIVAYTTLCAVSFGFAASPRAHAAVANPVNPWHLPPAGAIQVAWQGQNVQNVQVYSGNPNDAVWLANQFNGIGWAYTFAGEMLVVPPSGQFVMADFLPYTNSLPWTGTMGPNSPFPGASITLLAQQPVPETVNGVGMWIEAEIQGGDIDVTFEQLLWVTYSYNNGT